MSLRRKRKVSAPDRLGSPGRYTTASPNKTPPENPQPHQRQLLSRKSSAFEIRRIYDQLHSPIAEVPRTTSPLEPESGTNNVFSEEDEGYTSQNSASPVVPSLPENPGEIALMCLINDFVDTSQTKIENFIKLVSITTTSSMSI